MTCECFDPRVSFVVIQKGFDKSFTDGVRAVGQEVENVFTRVRELVAPVVPEMADFTREYEIIDGRLHWAGDEHPVDYHLRRYTAWLIGRGASEELVEQSKLDRLVWKQVEKAVLDLEEGMSVDWLASKFTDPSMGVAIQSIAKVNGRLVQRSRLLPFKDGDEISRFVALMSEGKGNLSLLPDNGLSPLLGWVVKGEAIDFKDELPELIGQAIEPMVPELVIKRPVEMRPWRTWEWMRPELSLLIPESIRQRDSVDVRLGSVHEKVADSVVSEEVSVTEVPKYEAPVVFSAVGEISVPSVIEEVSGVNKDDRIIEEVITESTELIEGTEKFVAPTVTELPRYVEVSLAPPVVEKEEVVSDLRVSGLAQTAYPADFRQEGGQAPAEHFGGQVEILAPTVIRMIPVSGEVMVEPQPVVVNQVDQEDRADQVELRPVVNEEEKHKKLKSVKIEAFNYDSVISVIRETFNKQVKKPESVNSMKAEVIWLQKQLANVIADGWVGRWGKVRTEKETWGWLIHGLALMQFDEVEKKRFDRVVIAETKRWRLSPVRIWADRVTQRVRRLKDRIIQTGLSGYRFLFAQI